MKPKNTSPRAAALAYENKLYYQWSKLERAAHERWPEAEIRSAFLAGWRACERAKEKRKP